MVVQNPREHSEAPCTDRVGWPGSGPAPRARKGAWTISAGLLTSLALLGGPGSGAAQEAGLDLPPIPDDHAFTQDRASVLRPDAVSELDIVQEHAFEEHDTPIMVVTIPSRAEYGGQDISIERFARAWFDHWGIGVRDTEGELVNQGILVLVSVGDREARIELGADWGRSWDHHAQWIMDEAMVPRFEEGMYGAGAVDGAWELLAMAEEGPAGEAPRSGGSLVPAPSDRPFGTTPLPFWVSGALFVLGVGLLVAAWRVPAYRRTFLIGGLVLVVGSVVFWVLLALVGAMIQARTGGASHGGGSFGSAGGFGSGGFSGGGGATGSW